MGDVIPRLYQNRHRKNKYISVPLKLQIFRNYLFMPLVKAGDIQQLCQHGGIYKVNFTHIYPLQFLRQMKTVCLTPNF